MLRELGEMVRKLPGFLYQKTRDGGVSGAVQSLTIQGVKRGSVAVNEQFGPVARRSGT
jgi:hypothetical protein